MPEDRNPRTELDRLTAQLEVVEQQLKQLAEDKQQIRDRITELLLLLGTDKLQVDLDDCSVNLKLTRRVRVQYDEQVLQQRLGDRYRSILAPDMKRMRKHMGEIEHLLEPAMDLIGAPSRDRVELCVQAGTMSVSDFVGAFDKQTTTTLYVRRARPRKEDDQDAPY